MIKCYKFQTCIFLLLTFALVHSISGQTTIDWQKSFGTPSYDNAIKILNDEDGNIIIMGTEAHADITGDIRDYLMVTKLDTEGNEIWKTYHDVAYETNSLPFDYGIGRHFYTEDNGLKIINLVVNLSGNLILYKLFDQNGEFNYYENIVSPVLAVDRENVKIYAGTSCSVQQSCYGPDSLTIEKINPIPDSNFITIAWTYGLKQNIRTAPIQGHYDFDNNDIAVDEQGNVYLLTQIERWDFNFCTDCADVFVDAYSMIFKLNAEGEVLKQFRLNTTRAVVSSLRFLSLQNGNIAIREDDINNAGSALLTTIYHLDYELNVNEQFDLDRFYNYVVADANQGIYTVTNVYDENDPNIKGASDVLVSKFDHEGNFEWKSYYGGSSFDFPKGFVLTSDGGIAVLSNTESTDFDIEESHGYQDIWLVKLRQNITGIEDDKEWSYSFFPNPAGDIIQFSVQNEELNVSIFDMTGKELIRGQVNDVDGEISLDNLFGGTYLLKIENDRGESQVSKLVKI